MQMHGITGGVNTSLLAYLKQHPHPTWFPQPHPLFQWLVGRGIPNGMPTQNCTVRSWTPPYEILLVERLRKLRPVAGGS